MQCEQLAWTASELPEAKLSNAQLVLVCGSRRVLSENTQFNALKRAYPQAHIVYVSTTGNIQGVTLTDHSLMSTAFYFDKTRVAAATANRTEYTDSYETGSRLIGKLPQHELNHVLLFTDGLQINPSKLIEGANSRLPHGVKITGGVAGDGWEFSHTLVSLNEEPVPGQCVAVGLYGSNLKVSYGVGGGWDSFGPDRVVTKAENNKLFELDGKPALDLYLKYVGKDSEDHPKAAMFFPLGIRSKDQNNSLVRTVLGSDIKENALILAGDIQEGDRLRLMKSSTERLLDGAANAATQSADGHKGDRFALVVSCVGRQVVLGPRIEEELEELQQVLGEQTFLSGFYSYGEYAPLCRNATELHNQTLTITVFSEE